MTFYKRMPYRAPTTTRTGEVEIILYRTPTSWNSLSIIQQDVRRQREEQYAPRNKDPSAAIQLQGKTGGKQAMQLYHDSLSKRRKTAIPRADALRKNPSVSSVPPPSKAPYGSNSQSQAMKPGFLNHRESRAVVPITKNSRPKLKLAPKELTSVKKATSIVSENFNVQQKPDSLEAAFKNQRKIKGAMRTKTGQGLLIKGPKQVADSRLKGEIGRKTESVAASFDWAKWRLPDRR